MLNSSPQRQADPRSRLARRTAMTLLQYYPRRYGAFQHVNEGFLLRGGTQIAPYKIIKLPGPVYTSTPLAACTTVQGFHGLWSGHPGPRQVRYFEDGCFIIQAKRGTALGYARCWCVFFRIIFVLSEKRRIQSTNI